jgi:hypothetical protein
MRCKISLKVSIKGGKWYFNYEIAPQAGLPAVASAEFTLREAKMPRNDI